MKTTAVFDLFNPAPEISEFKETLKTNNNCVEIIKGLSYVKNFISEKEERTLIRIINEQHWLGDLKRRVQHYGYKYDYKSRSIDYSMFIGELPIWAKVISQKLFEEKYISELPDQLIINEYEPGQGIANHIDCEPCFGDTIISISLGSCCVMDLINLESKQKVEVMLESGSLIALTGDARYKWTHGIAQRKMDNFNGLKTDRKLRISMTFRKVILK